MKTWVRELNKEGLAIDPKGFMPEAGLGPSYRRGGWWREPFFMVGTEQKAEPMDYELLPETGEAFIYVAMSRLMARRLARS
jgi:hypothetical protein